MKAFTPFWFKPSGQDDDQSVEFELKPLDQRTLYLVQSSMDFTRGFINVDGAIAAFNHSVINWRGLPEPFSSRAKREVTEGVGDIKWTLWLAQIAGELYKRSILGDAEVKNS